MSWRTCDEFILIIVNTLWLHIRIWLLCPFDRFHNPNHELLVMNFTLKTCDLKVMASWHGLCTQIRWSPPLATNPTKDLTWNVTTWQVTIFLFEGTLLKPHLAQKKIHGSVSTYENTKAWVWLNSRNSSTCHWDWNRNFQLPGIPGRPNNQNWCKMSDVILWWKIFMISLLPTSYLKMLLSSWHHDIPCLAFSVSFLKLFDDHHTIPLPHLGPRGRHFASHRPREGWKAAVLGISVGDSRRGGKSNSLSLTGGTILSGIKHLMNLNLQLRCDWCRHVRINFLWLYMSDDIPGNQGQPPSASMPFAWAASSAGRCWA